MATTIDEFDDLVSAKETASQASGKYLAIDVPDYEDSVKSASSDKRSYLRLGAADPDWTGEPGADLVALAYLAGATGRESAKDGNYDPLAEAPHVVTALSAILPDLTPGDVGDMFIDDQRERGLGNERAGGAPGHGFTEDERRAISARLHTDAGWRDHTDGNRISTTRGDKVEVVYGNYKLVVLGRQANPELAQGWEANGNHVQDFADGTMPGASVTVEWVPDTTYGSGNADGGSDDRAKGAWLLQNSTERVYQYSRNAGNFRQQNWGDLLETYTGSENPENLGTTDDAGLQGHPTFRDQALGNKSSSAPTASSIGLPRGNPTIIERTWAAKMDSQWGSESLPVPEITEVTHAELITERVFAKHIDSNKGTKGHRIGKLHEASWTDVTLNYRVANFVLDMSTAGLVVNIFAGPRLVLELATSVQVTGLLKIEATIGWKHSFHNGKNEATLAKNELDGIRTSIAGTVNDLATTNTSITGMETKITNVETEIGKVKTRVGDVETAVSKIKVNVTNINAQTAKLTLLG